MRPATLTPGVLIVDDEPCVRRRLYETLRNETAYIWVAANGATAVEILKAYAEEIEVALVDLSMPGMSGTATVAALHAIKPSLPCVLLTAIGDVANTDLLASGAVGVIPKLLTPASLHQAVAHLSEQGPRPRYRERGLSAQVR